jgi:RecB family exonuclease
LLAETTVRTGGATHPSLRILGAIEARLARADRMILAGLEEGVWPNAAPVDPFLSRPMRAALPLPAPERRLGQTAQDFVQAACADEAVLVHCERRGGQPAVRSRWLWRLEMLTRGADAPDTPVRLTAPEGVADWTRALDAPPPGPARLAPRPAPAPPVERRPRSLYVTGVERWVRDPYALYARRILNLEPMERPGASAEALARGNAVHKAIERLTEDWPDLLPDDLDAVLERLLLEELGAHGFEDAAMAREAPLAKNAARWLAGFETERRARGVQLLIEQQGALTFDAPGGPFTVKAYADRIEVGALSAAVMDFKTGQVPSAKQIKAGFAPQLTLTGAILAAGGFKETNGPVPPEELTYVRVVGRKKAGEVAVRAAGPEAQISVRRRPARPDGARRRVRPAGDALPLMGRASSDGQLQPLQPAGPRLGVARHRRRRRRRGGMNLHVRDGLNPQTRAADPARSVFVTANAGSGKTTTLVSRVARLLLGGAAPSAILCVTYTKAAAAEMQARLFETLGKWAVMDDGELSAELAKLDDSDPAALNPARLSEARRLFARALETPGGLKIQTIHAFCEKLLRRFPIEAGVSPRFTVLENEASVALSHAAREDLARAALADAEGPVGEAYSHFAVELDWGRFQDLLALIEAKRAELTDYVARVADGRAPGPYVLTGADPQKTPEDIEADFLRWLDRGEVRRMAELMATGSKTDKDRAAELIHALDHDWSFHGLGVVFLTGSGSPRKSMATKQAPPDAAGWLADLQDKFLAARDQLRAAKVADDTIRLLTLANAHAALYEAAKTAHGALDFSDLVARTVELLTVRSTAAWVLYKLDGGVDHVLIDEAQDTAPEQWAIMRALTGEFFTVEGTDRTVFAVGDEKQSIYSFQGARPERLRQEAQVYDSLITGAGGAFEGVPLETSYRSTEAVLSFVDEVFATPERARAWSGKRARFRTTPPPVRASPARSNCGPCSWTRPRPSATPGPIPSIRKEPPAPASAWPRPWRSRSSVRSKPAPSSSTRAAPRDRAATATS